MDGQQERPAQQNTHMIGIDEEQYLRNIIRALYYNMKQIIRPPGQNILHLLDTKTGVARPIELSIIKLLFNRIPEYISQLEPDILELILLPDSESSSVEENSESSDSLEDERNLDIQAVPNPNPMINQDPNRRRRYIDLSRPLMSFQLVADGSSSSQGASLLYEAPMPCEALPRFDKTDEECQNPDHVSWTRKAESSSAAQEKGSGMIPCVFDNCKHFFTDREARRNHIAGKLHINCRDETIQVQQEPPAFDVRVWCQFCQNKVYSETTQSHSSTCNEDIDEENF